MKTQYSRLFIHAAPLLLTACPASVGVSGMVTVPPDAAQTCASHCETIGMTLGAVAIMASTVGCVCQPEGTTDGSTAAIQAGMATILVQQRQQQQQQQQTSSGA